MNVLAMVLAALAIDGDAVDYPKPITAAGIEVTPVIARISEVPTVGVFGERLSKDKHFLMGLRLTNRSSTKRVDFLGWGGEFSKTFRVTDEHGNHYRPISFGISDRIGADESGETIEPQGSRRAIVAFEKPIPLANVLTIDFDGGAVGADGQRLKWVVRKKDWEQPGRKEQDQPGNEQDTAAEKPEPKTVKRAGATLPSREWTSADGLFTVTGRFVSMTERSVKVARQDGKEITIPLDKLSKADQNWLREFRRTK